MVASARTIAQVRDAVLRHIDAQTARRLVADLRRVTGNASFTATIDLLAQALEDDHDRTDARDR